MLAGTWGNPVYALYGQFQLLQPLSIFGVFGLELLLLCINFALGALAIALMDRIRPPVDRPAADLRWAALAGAEILFYPTAIGWHPSERAEHGEQQQSAWETIQRSHAIANGVYVCAVNRVGHEGESGAGIEFWGGSFVADPGGRVLVKGGMGEEVLTVTIDLAKVDVSRTHWPFLRDRRIDAYGDISRRYLD